MESKSPQTIVSITHGGEMNPPFFSNPGNPFRTYGMILFVLFICPFAVLAEEDNRKPVSNAKSQPAEVSADHARKMKKGVDIFKKHVRSILVKKCLDCHGKESIEGDFNLATRKSFLKGGAEGPAVIPGDAGKSRLYKLIAHREQPYMPYEEKKLSEKEIAYIAAWIDHYAPYDQPLMTDDVKTAAKDWTKEVLPASSRNFWAFQPLRHVSPPKVKNLQSCRTPIDRFIRARLEQNRLQPNSEISKRQLIRRVYLDLLGLPPGPEEIDEFIHDSSPDAYEKLVDRLLASPHYGERWGRHWLDLSRFAESHGFEHDYDRKAAYHFRDFVIQALNDDLPYDTFIKWQLAGDEFAPQNNLAMMATGFLAAGVHSTQITKNEVEKHRYDELDDIISTIGTAMLGLTVGCARCHNHKYDPIPQVDYYRLISAFTTTVRSEILLDFSPQIPSAEPVDRNKPVEAHKPGYETVLVSSEGLKPVRLHSQGDDFLKETHFLGRGNPDQKMRVASPGFLQVLMTSPEKEKHWPANPPKGSRTSFKRSSMAVWITDTQNGAGHLLARVIVNRLWQHHFGRGIVATPSDFGIRGEPASHPELLDWLATELIRYRWQLKPIHKLILTSSAYRRSSKFNEHNAKIDDDNKFLWSFQRHRLEAEVIRDVILTVTGSLDTRMFGPGTLEPSQRRRSIYFTVKRSKMIPMMQVFDAPESLSGMGQRTSTTIAPQALLLMNNPQIRSYVKNFAICLISLAGPSHEKAVREGYQTALGRKPTPEELADNVAFLKQQTASYKTEGKQNGPELALADFCQVLICLNEFVYVE
jgi:mono/diheme cytochrome c family protein